MITKQHSHYLKFLAKGHNFLLLSSRHFKEMDEVSCYFNLEIQRVLNDDELDNIANTLMQNSIDVVVVDFVTDIDLAKQIYKSIKKFNERIVVLAIVNSDIISDIYEILNKLDALLIDDFTLEELKDKLFISLSVFYAIKAIGARDMRIEFGSSTSNDELDKFFDIYEGQLIFIVDDLIELNKSLKAGDLSTEILKGIARDVNALADIFAKEEKISAVVDVFRDFSSYLDKLKISEVRPQSLHAFDYLCAIVDDTNTYMMEMFVDRVFRDVYIFHHSFENNLRFMKDALSLKDEQSDDSELEFF
ncbi:MAG: hypothetical protein JXQ66_03040 [Campylobacterales bacterium]|nr:hypothetical protein [Campylobacterales bacterium]